MRRGCFAHDNGMDTILTEQGVYHIFYAENGALTEDAHTCFRRAAACGAPLIYADEEAHLPDGRKKRVTKPDWSPDTLRSCNYIGSPFAASRALCESAGMPHANTAAERYAFLLRMAEQGAAAQRIARVLYRGAAEPPCTDTLILREALRKQNCPALVTQGQVEGSFCVRYPIPHGTRVSCIVIGAEDVNAIRATLEAIVCRTTYPNVELIVCDGGGIQERKEAYYAALTSYGAAKMIRVYNERNEPKLINMAAEEATGETLLFLPAGVEPALHDTIERMLEYALLSHIGAVGGITNKHGRPQPGIIHNASVIDGAMMTRADYFIAQAGFDVTFERVGYMRAFTQLSACMGRYNVITPYAVFSNAAQPRPPKPTKKNRLRIQDLNFSSSKNSDD